MSIILSGTTGIDAGNLPVSNCGNTEVEGNLNLSGVGTRITGDFSNATYSNRIAFQTNVPNTYTTVAAIPNGTGANASFQCYSSSDMNNSTRIHMSASTTVVEITSSYVGAASYVPLVFSTGGTERVRIDTTGNLLLTSGTGGLGYGTGAGGTVTQLTSKSTAVVLNKPTGTIITHNATMVSGAAVSFSVTNTLVSNTDTIVPSTSTTSYAYTINCVGVANGSFIIRIVNNAASSLSENIAINFTIIKGANA